MCDVILLEFSNNVSEILSIKYQVGENVILLKRRRYFSIDILEISIEYQVVCDVILLKGRIGVF